MCLQTTKYWIKNKHSPWEGNINKPLMFKMSNTIRGLLGKKCSFNLAPPQRCVRSSLFTASQLTPFWLLYVLVCCAHLKRFKTITDSADCEFYTVIRSLYSDCKEREAGGNSSSSQRCLLQWTRDEWCNGERLGQNVYVANTDLARKGDETIRENRRFTWQRFRRTFANISRTVFYEIV